MNGLKRGSIPLLEEETSGKMMAYGEALSICVNVAKLLTHFILSNTQNQISHSRLDISCRYILTGYRIAMIALFDSPPRDMQRCVTTQNVAIANAIYENLLLHLFSFLKIHEYGMQRLRRDIWRMGLGAGVGWDWCVRMRAEALVGSRCCIRCMNVGFRYLNELDVS